MSCCGGGLRGGSGPHCHCQSPADGRQEGSSEEFFTLDCGLGTGWDLINNSLSLGITWGKVVSLYSVAAGLAVDCVRQAQPAMVHALVDCLGEFVRKTLATWLRRRGGWVSLRMGGAGKQKGGVGWKIGAGGRGFRTQGCLETEAGPAVLLT